MLRGTKALVHKLGMIVTTNRTLPFLILCVIGAAFVIAFVFEAGPAVVFAVLVMGCLAAVMESTTGGNEN
jgi:branched-subunit amino acid transport protein AzlD